MSKALTELLSKAYKKDAEYIEDFLTKSDEEQAAELLALDKTRIGEHKTKLEEAKSQARNKAKAETLGKFETELRKKFEIEDEELTGEELITTIVDKQKTEALKKAGKGEPEITEEILKKSPVYITLQQQHKKALDDAKKAADAELNTFKASVETEKVLSKVQEKALEKLEGMNPVLPEDATIAGNQKKMFAKEILGKGKWEVDEKGSLILKDNDGKPVEDEHGTIVDFDSVVEGTAKSFFVFNQSQQRSSTGNGGSQFGSGKTPASFQIPPKAGSTEKPRNVALPKTIEEMGKIARDSSIPIAERQKIGKAFEEVQKAKVPQ
jgi:hypothetical protein